MKTIFGKSKFFSGIALACILVLSCSGFSGCKKANKKTSNSTAGVISNGGMVVQKDNFLFYVGGADTVESENKYGKVTGSAIYRVEVNSAGEKIGEPHIFVPAIVGFENGSIHIFGNFLYYATPSTSRNKNGKVLSGLVEFWRIGLDGKKRQKLYVTTVELDDIQYAFYPRGENDLFLLVYEPDSESIVSVDIGTNPVKKTIAKDAKSVVFSENGEVGNANDYVFFSKAPGKDAINQGGTDVFRILPDGTDLQTLYSGREKVSLLSIRDSKLVWSLGENIYVSDDLGKFSKSERVLSYKSSYTDLIMFSYKIIVLDNEKIIHFMWGGDNPEDLDYFKVCDAKAKFLTTATLETEELLFFTISDILYVAKIEKDATKTKLAKEEIKAPEGLLMPEIVGDYLYFMKATAGEVRLHRISIHATTTTDPEKL